MIFVRRKGPQSARGPEIPDETEEAALGEEEAPTEEPRNEHMEEASTSRGNQRKLDALIADFEDFKAQTQLNFKALKQKLQTNQEEHLSNFGAIIKLLEGIQVQIHMMQRQPSPPAPFTPTAEATPLHSPTGDCDPMLSQSSVPDGCGTEEPMAHDASQSPLEEDVLMREPESQSKPPSPPIIHIEDSDDDSALANAHLSQLADHTTEVEQPVEEPQIEEPIEESLDEEPVAKKTATKPVNENMTEAPIEEPPAEAPVEPPIVEEPIVTSAATDPVAASTNEARPQQGPSQPATFGQFPPQRVPEGMSFGPSTSEPPRAFNFTPPSFGHKLLL